MRRSEVLLWAIQCLGAILGDAAAFSSAGARVGFAVGKVSDLGNRIDGFGVKRGVGVRESAGLPVGVRLSTLPAARCLIQHGPGALRASTASAPSTTASDGVGVEEAPWMERLKAESERLDRRLYQAPYGKDSKLIENPDVIDYGEMVEQGGGGKEAMRLVDSMRRNGYAVVRLPETDADLMKSTWEAARGFVSLGQEERERAAGGRMRRVEGMVGVIGYGVMPDGNCFLEMRVDDEGKMVPSAPDMDQHVPGFSDTMTRSRQMLTNVAVDVIRAAATSAGVADVEKVMSLVDDGKNLGEGKISSTQHRLCSYEADEDVTFEAHTDTTFVTLIPRAAIPGLEVWTEESGWVCPEGFECEDASRYVTIMPGNFLDILFGNLDASVHRVTNTFSNRRSAGGPARLSLPLLVRARGDMVVERGATVDACSGLQGAKMFDLHAYLTNPPERRD